MRLRRERKIINKMELTRLQRNMEACVASIDELERSVTSGATLYAVLLGLVGTAFLAMATFAVVAPEPRILLCVILAIPGFADGPPALVCLQMDQKKAPGEDDAVDRGKVRRNLCDL